MIEGALILPDDVAVIPATELPGDVLDGIERSGLESSELFAVVSPRRREGAKLVAGSAAELLLRFRTPSTLVEVLRQLAAERGEDPADLLDRSFDFVQECVAAHLLVAAGAGGGAIRSQWARDEVVEGYTVVCTLSVQEDTEVAQARAPTGDIVALKAPTPGAPREVHEQIEREAESLRRLAAFDFAPALVGAGLVDGRPFVAAEWRAGVSPVAYADELSLCHPVERGRSELHRVVGCILDAYALLHESGFVHGDVSDDNVLVGADGMVTIVDFESCFVPGSSDLAAPPDRRGTAPFIEPEWAEAERSGGTAPAPTHRGEQYALAALVYRMVVGASYLELAVERSRALGQIATERPLAFTAQGCPAWPDAEAVLRVALSKAPEDRYPSTRAFADAWRAVTIPDTGPDEAPVLRELELLTEDVLEMASRLRFASAEADELDPWIETGWAGLGAACCRRACLESSPTALAWADAFLIRAEAGASEAGTGSGADTGSDAGSGSEADWGSEAASASGAEPVAAALLHGSLGVHATRASWATAMCDDEELVRAAARVLDSVRYVTEEMDVASGTAGRLIGASMLLEQLSLRSDTVSDRLRAEAMSVGDSVSAELARRAGAWRVGELSATHNLGIAHGWAGWLYADLRWAQASGSTPRLCDAEALGSLAALAEPVGRGVRWPWHEIGSAHDRLAYSPGWCNGSAGFVLLYLLAHRSLGDRAWLDVATAGAWHVCEAPLGIPDLCCGSAGRAYALLGLYRSTGEHAWLQRACSIAERAAADVRSRDVAEGEALGLFKGLLGLVTLVSDLRRPERSAMPLFEADATGSGAA